MTVPRRRFDVSPETQARLQGIYERVRRSFAENVATIDLAIDLLDSRALDEQHRTAAVRAAHRLVGAAETVGFPDATTPARRLEDAFSEDVVRPDGLHRLRVDAATLRRILSFGDAPERRGSPGRSRASLELGQR
jgi:HPt (histidine-containing phosphotransfer) domain-containing protein